MTSSEAPVALANDLDARFRAQCARLGTDEPWFGRFVLNRGEKSSDYLIGHRRNADERILDWRHPLAKAYYEARPGDRFELDAPHFADVAGTVASRCAITHASRQIRKVDLSTVAGHVVLVAGDHGFVTPDEAPGGRMAQEGLADIAGLLTPEQYRLITSSRKRPVIIQGRAGSGKTSVALYRVAWLTWPDAEALEPPVEPSRVLIVMFNKALSSFVHSMLAPLRLEGVQLDTFHGWALEAVKRAYGGKITISTQDFPGKAAAVALKKQLGILRATEAFVARQSKALESWLEERLSAYDKAGAWIARFRGLDQPAARRIALLRTAALRERDEAKTAREQRRLTEIHAILAKAMDRYTQYKEELLKLLADRELLAPHLQGATPAELEALGQYQSALQGEGGSDRRPGPQVSFEDLAILLRLIQLKHGGFPEKDKDGEVRTFDHLVVDEAQDFGAVELNVLLASVRSRTGVTIVGDANQKIVPDAKFMGWDALAAELGVEGARVAKLDVAHRSTAPIMALADSLVGDPASGGRPGARPTMTVVPDEKVVEAVAMAAWAAHEENPNAHVCVVLHGRTEAQRFHAKLADKLGDVAGAVRLGHNRDFVFGAGVTVTNMLQVKGLEFDAVILVDPTDENYPDTDEGRRHMYTMVTRAKDALSFVSAEPPGKLVRRAVDAGWVDLIDDTEVAAVRFAADEEEPF